MGNPIYNAMGDFTGFYEDDKPAPPKPAAPTKDDAKKPSSAPAKKPQQVTKPTADEPSGNNQKPTSNTSQAPDLKKPSPRKWNPLSNFSSYTYCLTLYLVTPEALNYYTINGTLPTTQNEADGYVLKVAESGGINSETDLRALTLPMSGQIGVGTPGLDFFIDDLTFNVQLLAADGQKTATIATTCNFKITEPTGYTFLTKMMKASMQLNALSPITKGSGKQSPPNLYTQHYMLGIKFYAYDQNGAPVETNITGEEILQGDRYGLYQRIFPITITKVDFKIDGRATIYNVEAQSTPHQVAFGRKKGIIIPNTEIQGSTVGEILGYENCKNKKSLMYQLNEVQSDFNKKQDITNPNKYIIEWVKNDVFDATLIKNSPLATDEEFNRAVAPMAQVNNVQQSNVNKSDKSQTANKNEKIAGLSPGTSIAMAIEQLISKSKYIVDNLTKENNARIETQISTNEPSTLKWYAIHPTVKAIGRDDATNDWVYEIKYQVLPYEIPYVKSQFVAGRSTYYGPVKQYSYLLTGENTEVVSINIEYNNQFYVQQPAPTDTNKTQNNKKENPAKATPIVPTNSVMGTQGSGGITNNAGMISDSVRANLYSPNEQMMISLTIMGDPDFLMDPIGKQINPSTTFGKFYGKNNAINPYGGQVFCEIIYDVAEDYGSDGLLDLNPSYSLQFYPLEYAEKIKAKGVIYKINTVQSTFSRGRFLQQLDMIQVPLPELVMQEQKKKEDQRETKPAATTANARKPSGTKVYKITPDQSDAETSRLNRTRPGAVNTGNPKDDAVVNQTRRGNIPRVGLSRLRDELKDTVRDDVRGGK